jgi:hypothetical protein
MIHYWADVLLALSESKNQLDYNSMDSGSEFRRSSLSCCYFSVGARLDLISRPIFAFGLIGGLRLEGLIPSLDAVASDSLQYQCLADTVFITLATLSMI